MATYSRRTNSLGQATHLPRIPPLSKDLLDVLDKRFPERCPDPAADDRAIWRATGRREVVRFLLEEFRRQSDNILKDTR